MEFSFVFSAPNIFNLAHTLYNISSKLEPLGLHHERDVSFADFGKLENETPSVLFDAFMNGEGANWNACSIEFYAERIWLNVVLDKRRSEFLNIYVDTNLNTILRNREHGKLPLYINALLEIARATQSVIGTGNYDFAQEMVSPDELLNCILNNPDNLGFPTDLGIIKISAMKKETVEALFSKSFRIAERAGYWLLIGLDLEQLVRDLSE